MTRRVLPSLNEVARGGTMLPSGRAAPMGRPAKGLESFMRRIATMVSVVGVSLLVGAACGDSGSSGLFGVDGGDGGDSDGGGATGGGGTGGGGAGGASGSGGGGAAGGGGASGTGGATGGAGGSSATGGTGGGGGGPCVGDGDCAGGYCHPTSRTCVACLFDEDCAGAAWCDDGACTPRETCVNSLGCAGNVDGRTVCDPVQRVCVGCVQTADCAGGEQCVANECASADTCQTSLDCPGGAVCDTVADVCVDCVGDNDCPSGQQCSARHTCEPECVSDNQCTPLGKLCDVGAGHCVECVGASECEEAAHCAGGFCEPDTCRAGSSRCEGAGVATCPADGAGWSSPAACGSQTTCVGSGGAASCAPWVCTADQTYCDPASADERVECAADGLSELSRTDCAATGLHCVGGACVSQVCTPSSTYCSGAELRQCASDGLSFVVADTCTSSEYCDGVAGACQPQVCSPGAAACAGSLAGTCNAEGSGLAAGAIDCASTGQSCAGGACVACAPTTTALRAVDLDLYVMVDDSGSAYPACTQPATTSGGTTCSQQIALDQFANDPVNAGVTLALQRHTVANPVCSGVGNPLATPGVGPSALTAGAGTIRAFLNSINPTGSTPTEAVLRGLVSYTTSAQTTGRVIAGVYLADGATGGTANCTTDVPTLAGILSAHRTATGIRTFVVAFGAFTPTTAAAEALALGGGGPPHAAPCAGAVSPCRGYHLASETDPAAARLALEDLQANAGGCTYRLPRSGGGYVSPSAISLALRTTTGASPATIPRVGSAGACSGHGWYSTTNERLVLCPASCTELATAAAPQAQATYCP